jgi:hypothetical protein
MTSVTSTQPPDDSGTDAFQRYGYQAQIAFPFCLRCYFEGDVVAIYCEHWEDLLIEYADRLRFVQIKTRNLGRGPWKYRHLLDEGGALRSLLRTHNALAAINQPRAIEYEIRLEGAVDGADKDVARLLVDGDGPSDGMCASCSDRLGIEHAEARVLLARVTVRPNEPPRGLIEAHNRDALRLIAGHLSANDLKDLYDAAIELIKRAMEADLLADAWPQAILEPDNASEAAERLRDGLLPARNPPPEVPKAGVLEQFVEL